MDPTPDDATTINPATPAVDTAPIAGPAALPDVTNGEAHAPAATQPVEASVTAGGSRQRWILGGGVAVAAVAAVALAAAFLAASPLPDALKYLPADSAVVVELRPELPGDQRQRLGNFLAHFPGFEDQSTLDTKLDEVLERLTSEASGGAVDYRTRVKPLLAGPMALSVAADAMGDAMAGGSTDGVLLVATTDGSATCASVFGPGGVPSTYRAVEIVSFETFGAKGACAVHERYLLVGTDAAVRGGLDARLDGKGVDGSSTYRAARSKLDGDQLASVFVDGDRLIEAIPDAAGVLGGQAPFPEGFWIIQGVRAADDALIADTYTPSMASAIPSGAPTSAPAAESRFAAVLPADTLGFVEFHGVAASIDQALAALGADPASAEALRGLQDALLMVGGMDNLTGWIQDAGLAVLPAGDAAGGALLVRGTDAATTEARLTQLRNLLVLASTGTDITLTDSEQGGVTITTVDLGDLSALLGDAGLPGVGVTERVEFAFAARDDLVVIGVGDGVVERILDVDAASSLATSATYGRVIGIAGEKNNLQLYVALDATLAFVERFLPADELEQWTTEFKPYLEHLAGFAITADGASSTGHLRTVITVK